MVEELHVTDNPADIGFYSGLVVSAAPYPNAASPVDLGAQDSLFAVAQLFTIFQWGRLSGLFTCPTLGCNVTHAGISDRIGRRPVILTGLLGVACGSFCFGLSKSFYQMLISRAMAGALSGNVACVPSWFGSDE